VTAETAIDNLPGAGGEQMFCYRHPTTETWLRCGRCDRPICTKCSVQGPVGSRCKECGRVAHDPLTTFTPRQLALAIGTALVAGGVAGYIAGSVGYFGVFVSFFAGGLVAGAVTRVIGFKRGPVMLSILFGGILAGTALGLALQYQQFVAMLASLPAEYAEEYAAYGMSVGGWLQQQLPIALLSAGAACAGAYYRLR
jgi:hypothetical protein